MTLSNDPCLSAGSRRYGSENAAIIGTRNAVRETEGHNLVHPPSTDKGAPPNLRSLRTDNHNRIESGGLARKTPERELPISTAMVGVNMRLDAGGVREMHWHKTAEWFYVLAGQARITSVDEEGCTFRADVDMGDLWYFPPDIPHSIQGTGGDGVEFLLVFDDDTSSEDTTFLLSDLFARLPRNVLARNFGWPEAALARIPDNELYILQMEPPEPLAGDRIAGAGQRPQPFSHCIMSQEPQRFPGGTVGIADIHRLSGLYPRAVAPTVALLASDDARMSQQRFVRDHRQQRPPGLTCSSVQHTGEF